MKLFKPVLFVLFTLSCVFLFSTCKKFRKGVLEIQTTFDKAVGGDIFYKAELVDDGSSYKEGVEFIIPQNQNWKKVTGYYWPNKSANGLGYKDKDDPSIQPQTFSHKDGSKVPGKNGHWAPVGGGSGSGKCPEGTWYSPACSDPHGVIWKFSGGKGSFSNKDCQGICTPMVFTFSYTMSGTTCSLVYDAQQPIVKCTGYADSRPPTPKNATITLSCNGSELTVTSGNGTAVFTK